VLTDQLLAARKRQTRLAVADWVFNRCPPFIGSRAIPSALRLAGATVAPSVLFWGMPQLTGPGDVASRLHIGELCGINFGCLFQLDAEITLEQHVAVGHEVMFLTRTYDGNDPARRGRPSGARAIRVEAGCWLGSRAVIMGGVTVGAGSVIGASVVVTSDVPPNTLMVGKRQVSIAKWR
jgi:maltose O-acetyltransferase